MPTAFFGCFSFTVTVNRCFRVWYAISNQFDRDTSMDLTYEIIKAAVAGEWATEKVIAHYDSYIEELATVKEKQPDGSVKTYVDEDLKQSIILKLLEEIPNFPMEEAEKATKKETETEI